MPPAPTPPRVVAVVVAYNRRDLLLEVLDALARQHTALARIVVIDNASTDDSAAVAAAAGPLVDLVVLERNTGGAGGFAAGLAVALERHSPDWVWMMDDDTIPTASALTVIVSVAEEVPALLVAPRATPVVPTVVAEPEITPVDALNVRPAGRGLAV